MAQDLQQEREFEGGAVVVLDLPIQFPLIPQPIFYRHRVTTEVLDPVFIQSIPVLPTEKPLEVDRGGVKH
jgi:hypothetical protein